MNDEQFRTYIEQLRRQIAGLPREPVQEWEEGLAAIEGLQLIYEELQTSLEAAELVEEDLLQQQQQATADYHRYYDLFQFSPIAYLVATADGVILEANQEAAKLLNVPQHRLPGKSLIFFVAPDDRFAFRTKLSQLTHTPEIQHWQLGLCPRAKEIFAADLHLAIVSNASGAIEALRIGLYDLGRYQQRETQPSQPQRQAAAPASEVPPSRPQPLNGLQVLVVDDETDAREFIAAVLESYGVQVMAVATVAAALEALQQFHADVLVTDIRMPNQDGYHLIYKVRELEAQRGRHIPAAAITAYLEEDRDKVLQAGFEAHLHKLAQPGELIKLVAELAGRSPS